MADLQSHVFAATLGYAMVEKAREWDETIAGLLLESDGETFEEQLRI